MTIRENYETRPDGRAGDIIWPEELQPQECSLSRDWLVIGVWSAIIGGGVAFWGGVAWLAGWALGIW